MQYDPRTSTNMLHFVITLYNSVAKLDDMFYPICFLCRLINKSEEVIDELFIYMNKGDHDECNYGN